ncbi:unnamed protein product, partial [Candidula unifasciata]
TNRLVCYMTNWSRFRPGPGKFIPEDIDPNLCTHIIYAYAVVSNKNIVAKFPEEESKPWEHGFRRIFSENAVRFLRDRGFDGLEVFWAYPSAKTSAYLKELLQALRNAFDEDAIASNQARLILTTALTANAERIHNDYGENLVSMEYIAHTYTILGVPRHMINIGIPTYGVSFQLRNPKDYGLGAPVSGAGPAGKYTGVNGMLAYYEVCLFIRNGAKKLYAPSQKVPYAFKDYEWVGFEDPTSVRVK